MPLGLLASIVVLVIIAVSRIDGATTADAPSRNGGMTLDSLEDVDPAAIAEFKSEFESAGENKQAKQDAAVWLVLLEDPDDQYYEYLESLARVAVDSDMPKMWGDSGGYSQSFFDWIEENDSTLPEAVNLAMSEYPLDVNMLARAGDPRAYSLFVDGLDSQNPVIKTAAAKGLGLIGNPSAIPLIQRTGNAGPEEERLVYAEALLYFDDPAADAIAAGWIPDPVILQGLHDAVDRDKAARANGAIPGPWEHQEF